MELHEKINLFNEKLAAIEAVENDYKANQDSYFNYKTPVTLQSYLLVDFEKPFITFKEDKPLPVEVKNKIEEAFNSIFI